MTLRVRSKQPRTIKTIIYNDIFASSRCKKVQSQAKQFKELFSLVCFLLCTELAAFCIELIENCIYPNQSELSNFFMYLIEDETCDCRVRNYDVMFAIELQ